MATFQSHSIAKWNLLRFLENPSGQAFKVTEPWRLLDLVSKEIAHFFSESRKLSARTACLAFQVPDRVVRYPKARARATAISRTDRYKNLIRHQHGSYIRTQVSVETNVLSFQSVHVTCGGGTRCIQTHPGKFGRPRCQDQALVLFRYTQNSKILQNSPSH